MGRRHQLDRPVPLIPTAGQTPLGEGERRDARFPALGELAQGGTDRTPPRKSAHDRRDGVRARDADACPGALQVQRGDVVLTRFPHASGVRGKKRPALVVSGAFN